MSLNIKNERAVTLVRELARRTGESQTGAVERAVAERLERLDRSTLPVDDGARADHVRRASLELLAELRRSMSEPQREELRGASLALYDEEGLPR